MESDNMTISSQLNNRDKMENMLKSILKDLKEKQSQMSLYNIEESKDSERLVSFVKKVVAYLIYIIKHCKPQETDVSGEIGEDIKEEFDITIPNCTLENMTKEELINKLSNVSEQEIIDNLYYLKNLKLPANKANDYQLINLINESYKGWTICLIQRIRWFISDYNKNDDLLADKKYAEQRLIWGYRTLRNMKSPIYVKFFDIIGEILSEDWI